MARNCGVPGSLRTKSELSSHQMAHPGVIPHWRSPCHSCFLQAPVVRCAHAVKELPQGPQGTTASTTPPFVKGRVWLPKQHHRFETPRSRGVGTPRCGRPADYLPSGTVGQWPPATGQWWNERRGGDPRTDHATKGADSELLGWQPKEKAS